MAAALQIEKPRSIWTKHRNLNKDAVTAVIFISTGSGIKILYIIL